MGTLKSSAIHITNCSELGAKVEIKYVSKVLNTNRSQVTLPPLQTVEVKLDIYPRKVNPDYRKQISIINTLNRDNDQVVQVKSNNIDKQRVTFHSLFYRIFTPNSTNFLDFGSATLNSPVVRTFTVDNISKKELLLQFATASPDEIKIYKKVLIRFLSCEDFFLVNYISNCPMRSENCLLLN